MASIEIYVLNFQLSTFVGWLYQNYQIKSKRHYYCGSCGIRCKIMLPMLL